jgi:hypothetical protein
MTLAARIAALAIQGLMIDQWRSFSAFVVLWKSIRDRRPAWAVATSLAWPGTKKAQKIKRWARLIS